MAYETLKIAQDGAVRTLTVNRPEVLNAQSRVMLEEFDRALMDAMADDAVRVVIVAGAGAHFFRRARYRQPAGKSRPPAPPLAAGHLRRVPARLEPVHRHRLPVARLPQADHRAQVQGYCIMGGLMLASACDLIIAADDAKFCDRTVRWGGAHVQYASLAWDIGVRKAKEYLFTGDWIDAEAACRLGLVNRVVRRDDLEQETMALAQRIAMQDSFALRMAKFSLNQMQDEMGYRSGVTGAFQTYAVTRAYRLEDGEQTLAGADRARQRDAAFGDNH